jgi:hypothetical protein
MPRSASKQLVVCINNDGFPTSLEKRKIYVLLRDALAEKRGLVRIIDESVSDYLYPKTVFSLDRIAAVRQEGGIERCLIVSLGSPIHAAPTPSNSPARDWTRECELAHTACVLRVTV